MATQMTETPFMCLENYIDFVVHPVHVDILHKSCHHCHLRSPATAPVENSGAGGTFIDLNARRVTLEELKRHAPVAAAASVEYDSEDDNDNDDEESLPPLYVPCDRSYPDKYRFPDYGQTDMLRERRRD
jgi:hypothetical protein